MTIRQRTWTTASGEPREALVVDVQVTGADGRLHRARRVAPVQTRRAAEHLERRLRAELLVEAGLGNDPDTAAVVGNRRRPHVAATADAPDARVPTLAAFAPDFLEHHRAKGNKPGELDAKRQVLRDHLIPSFGTLRLDQITTRLVDAYKAQKQRPPEAPPAPKRARPDRPPKTDRGRAALRPHTVNNHLTVLRALLNLAARWDLIARVPSFQMVKEDVRDPEYLTFDETRQLLAAAPPQWQTFLLVAVGTGLRVSELRALHWADVDLERRRIRVSRNLTRAGESSPKSRRPRTVPLGGDLVEALQGWQTRQGRPSGELVFCQGDGGALTPGQVGDGVEEAAAGVARDGIEGPNDRAGGGGAEALGEVRTVDEHGVRTLGADARLRGAVADDGEGDQTAGSRHRQDERRDRGGAGVEGDAGAGPEPLEQAGGGEGVDREHRRLLEVDVRREREEGVVVRGHPLAPGPAGRDRHPVADPQPRRRPDGDHLAGALDADRRRVVRAIDVTAGEQEQVRRVDRPSADLDDHAGRRTLGLRSLDERDRFDRVVASAGTDDLSHGASQSISTAVTGGGPGRCCGRCASP
jgi:integrase